MLNILHVMNNYLWNKCMIWLLLGAGLYFTVRLGFPQIKQFAYMWKVVLKSRRNEEGGISSFQALCTSAAAQVGTGNIVGVATAISMGGPGAVFWMWVTGFVGMGTNFVEATLAQIYKEKNNDGTYVGGPGYYISKGLGKRWLGVLFSIILIITMGFIFNAVQSNSISGAFKDSFNLPDYFNGMFIIIITSVVIFGGIKRIARVAEFLVPFMAGAYILIALFITIIHITELPGVLKLIISEAFGVKSVAGGLLGKTVMDAFRYGVARALFSNEAGMGSTPNAHATASVRHPARQGYTAMTSVFINTFFICTSTAAIILLTGAQNIGYEDRVKKATDLTVSVSEEHKEKVFNKIIEVDEVEYEMHTGSALADDDLRSEKPLLGVELTQAGAKRAIGSSGSLFVTLALFLFAWSTILANYYYGESSLRFMFPVNNTTLLWAYRIIVLFMIMFGSLVDVPVVWELADFFNGLMAFINIISILLLSGVAVKCINDYKLRVKNGEEDPAIDKTLLKELRKER